MYTGIIRRIDDLGRVLIPKALRKPLGWQEGTPLEISIENGGVFISEYVPHDPIGQSLKKLKQQVSESTLSCKTDILQSIFELEKRLALEYEEGTHENDR